MYEELDRRLVNVLQIDPRASWAKVGKILGVSPTTVAHRWQRLVDDGIAWITACPNLNQQMRPSLRLTVIPRVFPKPSKHYVRTP